MKVEKVKLSQVVANSDNPRSITDVKFAKLVNNILTFPKMLDLRPVVVSDELKVLGGNMRLRALQHIAGMKAGEVDKELAAIPDYVKMTDAERAAVTSLWHAWLRKPVAPIVYASELTAQEQRRFIILDNVGFGDWDWDELANNWDSEELADWGLDNWGAGDGWNEGSAGDETEEQTIERKRKEFEEKMAAGELDEDDPEYQEFVKKFEAKRTTDDCYTPDVVYDAVADWVANKYNVSRANFVRPFYPGGDYQNEKYKSNDIVVDNPPFSIMAEILKFYHERDIRFFLFGPHLTLFSSSSSSLCTALPVGVPITYANGATINTSFLTNLEDSTIRFRSEPTLYAAVRSANEENLRAITRQLPKYAYDHHIITTPFLSSLSRLGIDFCVPVAESETISQLDSQRDSGKAIYGKGYIVSDRVFAEREKAEREKAEREKAEREKAEREKAEREKAEREKAERWELSDRERAIIEKLNHNGNSVKPKE